jgi:pantoate--beta-alanine ligase
MKTEEASAVIYETLKKVNDWFRVITIPEIKERVQDIFDQQRNAIGILSNCR